jgi:hypothetical protein
MVLPVWQSDVASFSQAFRLLIREEGLGALFRGWLPTVLRYDTFHFLADPLYFQSHRSGLPVYLESHWATPPSSRHTTTQKTASRTGKKPVTPHPTNQHHQRQQQR